MSEPTTDSPPAYPNTGSLDKMAGCDSDTDGISGESGQPAPPTDATKEIGGPKGLEPTRYGDWEKNGRCIDF